MADQSYRPGQRVTINDLSNEIITLIADNIRGPPIKDLYKYDNVYHASTPTLANLSSCSRRLRELVEPILFQEFNEDPKSDIRGLEVFLARVAARPDLARCVKRLSFHAHSFVFDNDWERCDTSVFTKEDWSNIIKVIGDLEELEEDHPNSLWDVKQGRCEAIFCVVLSLLPNLQDLVLFDWGSMEGTPIVDWYLAKAVKWQKHQPQTAHLSYALPSLKSVHLVYYNTEDGMGPEVLIPWMSLPSINSIVASAITANAEDDEDENFDLDAYRPDWASNEKFPNVTHLHLEGSALNGLDMACILKTLPNLKHLEYSHGGSTVSYTSFYPSRLVRGMYSAKGSLETLVLEDWDCDPQDSMLEEFDGVSLKDFYQLKSLETFPNALYASPDGFNVETIMNLPPNLEILMLNVNHDQRYRLLQPIIMRLMESISAFPKLKKIDLGWRMIDYPDEPSPRLEDELNSFERTKALEVLSICKEAGIEMVMERSKPPFRILYDYWDEAGKISTNRGNSAYVEYPYSPKWEQMCAEVECDPKTGRKHKEPYPFKGIIYHYPPKTR